MRRRRDTCLAALEEIRTLAPEISLTEAVCFLYVCENEGINVRELAQLARLTPSTASRAARRLAEPGSTFALMPAAGFVSIGIQQSDRRGRILTLTPLGARLRDTLDAHIAAAEPIRAPKDRK